MVKFNQDFTGSYFNNKTQPEPMETIKNKEPEQTQESPSKEIINALVFVGVGVLIGVIFYNAYIYYITEYKYPEFPPIYQILCFSFVIGLSIAILIAMIVFIASIISGEYNNWLKQNIDPYLLKIKSWLNRRNEQ